MDVRIIYIVGFKGWTNKHTNASNVLTLFRRFRRRANSETLFH